MCLPLIPLRRVDLSKQNAGSYVLVCEMCNVKEVGIQYFPPVAMHSIFPCYFGEDKCSKLIPPILNVCVSTLRATVSQHARFLWKEKMCPM